MSDFSAFDNALRSLESIPLARVAGRLVRLNGILLESVGCPLMTGQLCRIESANHTLIDAQAVGFNRDITYLMPFKQPVGLMAGARVFPEEKALDKQRWRRLPALHQQLMRQFHDYAAAETDAAQFCAVKAHLYGAFNALIKRREQRAEVLKARMEQHQRHQEGVLAYSIVNLLSEKS